MTPLTDRSAILWAYEKLKTLSDTEESRAMLRRLIAIADAISVLEPQPRYYCNKCGYAGPVCVGHQRPNRTGECHYMAVLLEPQQELPDAIRVREGWVPGDLTAEQESFCTRNCCWSGHHKDCPRYDPPSDAGSEPQQCAQCGKARCLCFADESGRAQQQEGGK